MSHSIHNSLQTAGNWIKNHKLEIGLGVATTALAVAAVAATVLTAGTAAAAFGGIGVGAMIGSGAAVTGALTIGIGVINHSNEKKREKADAYAAWAAFNAARDKKRRNANYVGFPTVLGLTALAEAAGIGTGGVVAVFLVGGAILGYIRDRIL
jgi:hypothetical protein